MGKVLKLWCDLLTVIRYGGSIEVMVWSFNSYKVWGKYLKLWCDLLTVIRYGESIEVMVWSFFTVIRYGGSIEVFVNRCVDWFGIYCFHNSVWLTTKKAGWMFKLAWIMDIYFKLVSLES